MCGVQGNDSASGGGETQSLLVDMRGVLPAMGASTGGGRASSLGKPGLYGGSKWSMMCEGETICDGLWTWTLNESIKLLEQFLDSRRGPNLRRSKPSKDL